MVPHLRSMSRWWQLKHFLFSPLLGEMIQFDEHIFQMGWNHQLDVFLNPSVVNCSHTVASDRADRDYEWAVWLGVCSAPGRWLFHITPTKKPSCTWHHLKSKLWNHLGVECLVAKGISGEEIRWYRIRFFWIMERAPLYSIRISHTLTRFHLVTKL